MRRTVAVLAVCLATGCGDSSVRLGSSVDEDVRQRLLAAADRAAEANDGEAKHVEAVKTTRGGADELTGYPRDHRGDVVWVVQVSGTDYSCNYCSGPGVSTRPRAVPMRYIKLVLRASDYTTTDTGLGPKPTDLSKLGEVQVLRG